MKHWIIPLFFLFVLPLHGQGLQIFRSSSTGKYGIKYQGKVYIQPILDQIQPSKNGYAWASREGFWGIIHIKSKKWVVRPRFSEQKSDLCNLEAGIVFEEKEQKFGVMSYTGKWLIPANYHDIQWWEKRSDDNPRAQREWWVFDTLFVQANPSSSYGLMSYKGQLLRSLPIDKLGYFRDGFAPIAKGNSFRDYRWGVINKEGRIILPCKYDVVGKGGLACQVLWRRIFYEGKISAYNFGEEIQYFDVEGNQILETESP